MILFFEVFRSFSKERRLQKNARTIYYLDLKILLISKVKFVAIVDFDLIFFQT